MSRKNNNDEDTSKYIDIHAMIKGTLAFVSLGIISFIGSWGIDISKSVAELKERSANVEEMKEFFQIYFVDELKTIRSDMKEIRHDVNEINRRRNRDQ